jgi:hypothetical protein
VARWLAIYSPAMTLAGISCLGFVLLLTPTGSLPSPRWRWWARVAAAAPVVYLLAITLKSEAVDPAYGSVTNPLGLQAFQLPITITHVVASAIIVVAVVVGALSLVVRFRRARGTERQQLRWVALAAVLASLAVLVALAGMALRNTALLPWAFGVSFAVLPPAIGAAILRYGLYDLDRILSRTLAYGLLTLLLGGGYGLVVLGLGQLVGRESPWLWRQPPWPWPRCSSRRAAASRPRWTGGSTAAATTRPGSSRPSGPACVTRSTWTCCTPSCWPWSTRPCSPPGPRCGCGRTHRQARSAGPFLVGRPPVE